MKKGENTKQLIITSIFLISIILCFIQISTTFIEIRKSNQMVLSKMDNLKELKKEINYTEKKIKNTYNQTILIKQKNKTNLYDPSYEEAYNFVNEDKTELNEYDPKYYNCDHFSKDFNNNAERKGVRCAFVVLNMIGDASPHAIVAFKTTDKGTIYFEPQTDERVIPEIGKDYWKECIISENTDNYPEGNIITEVVLYW